LILTMGRAVTSVVACVAKGEDVGNIACTGLQVSDNCATITLTDPQVHSSSAIKSKRGPGLGTLSEEVRVFCLCSEAAPRGPELLIKVGEFAHVLQRGIQQYYSSDKKDKTILQSLHVQGLDEAKGLHSRLGRRGRVPWLAPRYRQKLPYIDPETSVVLPAAHNLLHGVLHSFIAFGVGKVTEWKLKKDGEGSSLMPSIEAIAAVKVRFSSS
jgi:hypothetical protein